MCRGRQVRDGGAYGCAVPRAYANLNPGLPQPPPWAWLLLLMFLLLSLLYLHHKLLSVDLVEWHIFSIFLTIYIWHFYIYWLWLVYHAAMTCSVCFIISSRHTGSALFTVLTIYIWRICIWHFYICWLWLVYHVATTYRANPVLLSVVTETWTMRKVDSDRIQSFHMQALRRILGIRWYDKVPNEWMTSVSNKRRHIW